MSANGNIVDYNQVKAATQNNSIYIIDVRDPKELQDTGIIPNSLNIPLAEVPSVFESTSNDQFKEKYGRPKPVHETPLIFSCLAGGRATKAANAVTQLGFNNVKIYAGSWKDWSQHIAQ